MFWLSRVNGQLNKGVLRNTLVGWAGQLKIFDVKLFDPPFLLAAKFFEPPQQVKKLFLTPPPLLDINKKQNKQQKKNSFFPRHQFMVHS